VDRPPSEYCAVLLLRQSRLVDGGDDPPQGRNHPCRISAKLGAPRCATARNCQGLDHPTIDHAERFRGRIAYSFIASPPGSASSLRDRSPRASVVGVSGALTVRFGILVRTDFKRSECPSRGLRCRARPASSARNPQRRPSPTGARPLRHRSRQAASMRLASLLAR
jgi:hypothetical protein